MKKFLSALLFLGSLCLLHLLVDLSTQQVSAQTASALSCTFTRGDQNPKAAPYQSPLLLSYFQEVAQKTGVPAAVLAAIARVESTTGTYSISNYSDSDIRTMEEAAKSGNYDGTIPGTKKALCPKSPTGARGIMQIQPKGTKGYAEASVQNGARFLNKNAADLTLKDYCDPKSNMYLAAGFILKKLQGVGYGNGTTWDSAWNTQKKVFDATAKSYYGCLEYGDPNRPNACAGPYSYGDDIWKSFQDCKEAFATPITVPQSANTAPATGTSGGGSMTSNEVITRVGNPPTTGGSGTLKTILEWDTKIVDSLERGSFFGTLSRLTQDITNGTYNTRTWAGISFGTVYWCTYSIIDAYRLAGIEGLDKSKHAAVVNMVAFWEKAGAPYVYVQPTESNALGKVQPGFAMLMNHTPPHNNDEHVAMVKEITIDSRGNGKLVSQDSNSSSKTHPYTITDGRVIGTPYKIVGFGGIEGGIEGSGNDAIQAIFAKLPGKASATVILPDGTIVERNGKTAQPAFSMIKLWVAAATMQAAQSGRINLSDSYTMTSDDKNYGGTGIIIRGQTANTLTYEQYLNYMLVYSDNIATNVLINAIGGFGAVNAYAQQNGYAQTRLQRYIGVTNYSAANDNYSSSFDGAMFMKNLMERKVVSSGASDKIISILSERTQKGADGNYIGRSLSQFVGKSGVGPKTRNDAGSFVNKSGKRIYESIMLTDLTNELQGEQAIGSATQQINALSP